MKIVLIGFMGSGKTTVAKLLSQKLSIPLYEIDDYTTALAKASIREIIEKHGEAKFRDFERQVIKSFAAIKEGVISTGGGSVLTRENQIALSSNAAKTVYLKTSFDTIKQRLSADKERPLFRDPVKAKLLFEERAPIYEQLASAVVETDNLSPEQVTEKVIVINL